MLDSYNGLVTTLISHIIVAHFNFDKPWRLWSLLNFLTHTIFNTQCHMFQTSNMNFKIFTFTYNLVAWPTFLYVENCTSLIILIDLRVTSSKTSLLVLPHQIIWAIMQNCSNLKRTQNRKSHILKFNCFVDGHDFQRTKIVDHGIFNPR